MVESLAVLWILIKVVPTVTVITNPDGGSGGNEDSDDDRCGSGDGGCFTIYLIEVLILYADDVCIGDDVIGINDCNGISYAVGKR